jgi:hypothetical protein
MPVLAGRSDRAKAESDDRRKLLFALAVAAAVGILGLIIWLVARGHGETESSPETAAEEPSASPSLSGDPSRPRPPPPPLKPGDKGKGKAKWRKPRGPGE